MKEPNVGLIFGETNLIDEKDNIIRKYLSTFRLPDLYISKGEAANLLLKQGCYVDSEACFMKRSMIEKLGPMDESLRYACDYEYFIKAGFDFDFAYTKDTISAWRIHPGQQTSVNKKRYNEYREVLFKYFNHHNLSGSTQLFIIIKIMKSFLAQVYYNFIK